VGELMRRSRADQDNGKTSVTIGVAFAVTSGPWMPI